MTCDTGPQWNKYKNDLGKWRAYVSTSCIYAYCYPLWRLHVWSIHYIYVIMLLLFITSVIVTIECWNLNTTHLSYTKTSLLRPPWLFLKSAHFLKFHGPKCLIYEEKWSEIKTNPLIRPPFLMVLIARFYCTGLAPRSINQDV